jgi:hypothetical protein
MELDHLGAIIVRIVNRNLFDRRWRSFGEHLIDPLGRFGLDPRVDEIGDHQFVPDVAEYEK